MTKGKRREKQCADIFEAAGFRTYRPQESKWGETDIFGLFDILAVPGPGDMGQVRLIQVKSNRAQGIEAWAADALEYASHTVRPQFAVCYDREGWRLIDPYEAGGVDWRTLYDERDDDEAMSEGLTAYLKREYETLIREGRTNARVVDPAGVDG